MMEDRCDCDSGRDHGKRTKIIGITGGICGGKSTVCEALRRAGATTIDCDSLAHGIYAPGTPTHSRVIEAFGADILEREATEDHPASTIAIDRRKLGAKVFGNKEALERLNGIVWPAVHDAVADKLKQLCSSPEPPRAVFIEAALLLEAGYEHDICTDGVWVAYVPPDVARTRLMSRNGLSEQEARARIASQKPVEYYTSHATLSFNTDRPREEVTAKVLEAYDKLLQP